MTTAACSCSNTNTGHGRRSDIAWRLSGYCLMVGASLAVLAGITVIAVGNPRQMLPPLESGFSFFGGCILLAALFSVVGGFGMIVSLFLRKLT